jgi:uncharacterized protein (DUF302 family)
MTNEPESVAWNGQGVVTLPTAGTVAEMLERLLGMLKDRGIKVFAVIDHSGEAARVGQSLPNTKLVLFGNPSAGTSLMQTAPLVALDLPLKILIGNATTSRSLATTTRPISPSATRSRRNKQRCSRPSTRSLTPSANPTTRRSAGPPQPAA